MGGAARSEEVVQRIIQIKDKCVCVRGNREKYIIEGMPLIVHDEKMQVSQSQIERNEWQKNQLSNETLKFINELPKEIYYEIEGKKIYIAHYPMNQDGSFRKHIKLANKDENEEMFSGIKADVYLYGHTHLNVYNEKNGKVYINPGSLGCPGKTSKALYGILDINKDNIKYQQLELSYDVEEVINDIKNIAFPGYEGVLNLFYGMDEYNLT